MARYTDPGHIPGAVFIPNCASVRLIWELANGKQASNVMHGSYTSPPPRTMTWINGLFNAIGTAFAASNHQGNVSDAVRLVAVGVRDMAQTSPPGGWTEIRSDAAAVSGGNGTDPLPPNVSFVVSLKTDRRGQANRGRVYLPGFAENMNTPGGVCDDAASDNAVDFIRRVQTGMSSNGLTLCIAQPARAAYTSPVPPFTEHDQRPARTVQVNSVVKLNNVWDSTRLRSLR
jgi:hypothetical protein